MSFNGTCYRCGDEYDYGCEYNGCENQACFEHGMAVFVHGKGPTTQLVFCADCAINVGNTFMGYRYITTELP